MSRALLLQIRSRFRDVADDDKAPQMQNYMKSTMPVPRRFRACPEKGIKGDLFRFEVQGRAGLTNTVLYIWRNARFREEWYAAVMLCEWKRAREFQTPQTLSLYEEMIVGSAWWDVVDALASHCVGELLRRYPKPIRRQMLAWSRSGNMWKRRTSIICQLGFKRNTDLDLLYACIRPSLGSKEFFLRKAIGWALRQYAWTDPGEVQRYVRDHEGKLSPLSRREALKNVSVRT